MASSPIGTELRPLRRTEYDQLARLGAFADERVELIDGAIVRMSPIGARHNDAVALLTELLVLRFAGRARVFPQCSFAASELSEPEPDLSLLPLADYSVENPQSAYLIIEVAESSLAFDRDRKARLYAESQVPEYWIVNLRDRVVEVHREPSDGKYRRTEVLDRDASIRLVAFPEVEIRVGDFVR